MNESSWSPIFLKHSTQPEAEDTHLSSTLSTNSWVLFQFDSVFWKERGWPSCSTLGIVTTFTNVAWSCLLPPLLRQEFIIIALWAMKQQLCCLFLLSFIEVFVARRSIWSFSDPQENYFWQEHSYPSWLFYH